MLAVIAVKKINALLWILISCSFNYRWGEESSQHSKGVVVNCGIRNTCLFNLEKNIASTWNQIIKSLWIKVKYTSIIEFEKKGLSFQTQTFMKISIDIQWLGFPQGSHLGLLYIF